MAVIKTTALLAEEGFVASFDQMSFRLRKSSGNDMTWADDNGATVEIHGSGFKYSHGDVTAGTATSATITDSDGHLLLTMSHGHVDPTHFTADIDYYGMLALGVTFATGDDHVNGSKVGERLYGQAGNDILKGMAGDDVLNGDIGNDHLIGGAGADTFAFTTGWGKDVIKDFDDTGNDQDVINLQFEDQYKHMEKHQVGDDVVLDFGNGDELIIDNATAAHITKGDFVFGPH
jgi:Ca2+-binding RTX toxin-like protein